MQNTNKDGTTGITGLPAFDDNYIWLIRHQTLCAVVDPGDAGPVLKALQQHRLQLRAIFLTHHHRDHTGGVLELVEQTGATVFGPKNEQLPHCDRPLLEQDRIMLPELNLDLEVLEVPGHTAGHIAYFGQAAGQAPVLFCGDTLFSGGSGRLFEGTPEQMVHSLEKIQALPDTTLVYCAHEYTLSNLRWALAVEPDNVALTEWNEQATALRQQSLPTIPTELGREKRINPFLRYREPSIIDSIRQRQSVKTDAPGEVFAVLREWKNNFS